MKDFIVRKCSVLFVVLLCCFVHIGAFAQNADKKISYKCENEKLSVVFEKLERLSGYYKLQFNYADVDKFKVTTDLQEVTLPEAVRTVISGLSLTFSTDKEFVFITKTKPGVLTTGKRTIYSGVVTDDNGEPLPGVNVLVKGMRATGVVTNIDGEYQIPLPEDKHTFVFSFVGMKTQEVNVQNNKRLTVRMQDDVQKVKETVVTGIYTRNIESFTGSAATFTAKELKTIGTQNVLTSLSAIEPSFTVFDNNTFGSDPNAIMDITVNGRLSINGLTDTYNAYPDQPLFILDGFETTLERISDLSMDRVESITVLKDAASTAIYGSKSANGVIVIETKKPEAGRLRFSYNGSYQVAWADLSDYNLMNASEKLEFEKLSGYYGVLDESGDILNDASRATYMSRLARIVSGVNSYWMNEPLRTAFTHDHNINAEGGDQAFRYGLTLRYRDTEGVMKGSGRQNVDGTVNFTYRNGKFSLTDQTNINYTDADENVVPFSDFSSANPYYSKRDENGEVYRVIDSYDDLSGTHYVYNPLWDYQQKSFKGTNNLGVNNNLNVEYRPIEKVRLTARVGYTISRNEAESFISPFANQYVSTQSLKRGSYSNANTKTSSLNSSVMASYGDAIGNHTYNIVLGAQLMSTQNNSASYSAIGYISDQFYNPNFSNGYPEGGSPSSSVSKSRSASIYLNGNYSYAMKYLVDLNVRRDGASVFGVNNPFSNTWSMGLAWNVHKESWFEQSDVLNQLKLRYSIGNPGLQNIDAKIANNVYTYYTSYQNMFGLAALASRWGNKNLKWQRSTQQNYGMNLDMFQNALHLTLDYSRADTDPILLTIEQPASTGASTVPMNIGATRNQTFTFTASYNVIRNRDWNWTVTASGINTTNKYRKIGNLLDKWNQEGRTNQTLVRYYDGASATALWAVKSAGIDPQTGNEVFIKKDGTYTYKWDITDEQVCGDTTPKIDGNLSSMLRWKGFSLNVNFRYRLGGQAVLSTLLNKVENISEASLKYNQDRRALTDRWKQPGDIARFKRIDDTSTTNVSSRFIADNNTLECKSVSLGYETTSAKWLQPMHLTSFAARVYMNDIFYISNVKEERGLDYPFQRAISASLSLRF